MGPYAESIKQLEEENREMVNKINKLTGIKELDTGLSLPSQWNLAEDAKKATEQPLQVARCNKIIDDGTDKKYVIHLKQIAKFVVKLSDKLSPTDV
jgi:26S proteasome regulatory subunit T1